MNIIKNFREQLGLSQQDLANYLSISKSQISMVESGLRELPTPALIKLAYFEQASIAINENIPQEGKLNLAKHVEICTKKMMLLEKKLTIMKNNYSQGLKLLQAITKSKELLTNTKDSRQDKQWFSVQEKVALKKINENSLTMQKLLNIQIKVIQFEIKLAMDNK